LKLSTSIGDSKPSSLLYIDTAKRDHPQAQIPRACKHFQVFVFGKNTLLFLWLGPSLTINIELREHFEWEICLKLIFWEVISTLPFA
jgi:hypothetical protein